MPLFLSRVQRIVLLGITLASWGCAASPAMPSDGGPVMAQEEPVEEPDAATDPRPDRAPIDEPPTAKPDASSAQIIDAQAPRDAGASTEDAAKVDAAPAPDAQATPPVDASSPAPAADASSSSTSDASAPDRDASATEGGVRDAGAPMMPGGRCQRSSDCQSLCVLTGILPCCREDRTCGCTWAPGAYCL